MQDRIFVTVFAAMWAIGIGLIGVFVYLRVFVVTDDAFDPMRMTSLNFLWTSCFVFLSTAAFAKLASICVPRSYKEPTA